VCQELSRVRRKANYLILLARVNQRDIFQGNSPTGEEGNSAMLSRGCFTLDSLSEWRQEGLSASVPRARREG